MRRLGLSQNLPREMRLATTVPKGDIRGTGPFALAAFRGSPGSPLPRNAARATLLAARRAKVTDPYSMTRGSMSMTSDETSNSSVAWGRPAK